MTAPASVLAVIQAKIAASAAAAASAKKAMDAAQAEVDKQTAALAQHGAALNALMSMPLEDATAAWRWLGTHLFAGKGIPTGEAIMQAAPAAPPTPAQVAAAPVLTEVVQAADPAPTAPTATDLPTATPGIFRRIVNGVEELFTHAPAPPAEAPAVAVPPSAAAPPAPVAPDPTPAAAAPPAVAAAPTPDAAPPQAALSP